MSEPLWLATISPPYESPLAWAICKTEQRAKEWCIRELKEEWGWSAAEPEAEWSAEGDGYAYFDDAHEIAEVREITPEWCNSEN